MADEEISVIGVESEVAMFDTMITSAVALHVTAFPAIVADFHRMEAHRFDTDAGGSWAPLSPATIEIESRLNYPNPEKILLGHGRLIASLTTMTEDTVLEITPEELVIGTSVPYARYHQTGPREIQVFGRGRATLPERRLVDLTEEDAARWAGILRLALAAKQL